jgi:hypothetical protein
MYSFSVAAAAETLPAWAKAQAACTRFNGVGWLLKEEESRAYC